MSSADLTGLDADRMRQWMIAQAMLSLWWLFQDSDELALSRQLALDVLRTAELLERVSL